MWTTGGVDGRAGAVAGAAYAHPSRAPGPAHGREVGLVLVDTAVVRSAGLLLSARADAAAECARALSRLAGAGADRPGVGRPVADPAGLEPVLSGGLDLLAGTCADVLGLLALDLDLLAGRVAAGAELYAGTEHEARRSFAQRRG